MAKNTKLVSLSELYRLTGKDRATIIRRLASIKPIIGAKNAKLYDREVAVQIILASREAIEDTEARERKLSAEAEKAELVVKKLKGELVSVDSMKSAAAELVKTLYTRIVRVLPGVVAQELLGKEPLEIEGILRTNLAAVFSELKSLPSNFITVDTDEEPLGDTTSI